MTRIVIMEPRFVDAMPATLHDGVLYVSMFFNTVVHQCCCGCGTRVVTPLSPVEWRVGVRWACRQPLPVHRQPSIPVQVALLDSTEPRRVERRLDHTRNRRGEGDHAPRPPRVVRWARAGSARNAVSLNAGFDSRAGTELVEPLHLLLA